MLAHIETQTWQLQWWTGQGVSYLYAQEVKWLKESQMRELDVITTFTLHTDR